jgi:hypothetical protein
MKLATSTALVLVTLQNPVPVPQLSQVPMGSMEGIVLRADSADPIAKAQVSLTRVTPPPPPGANPATPVTPPPPIPPVITDASGKFSFKDLEPWHLSPCGDKERICTAGVWSEDHRGHRCADQSSRRAIHEGHFVSYDRDRSDKRPRQNIVR